MVIILRHVQSPLDLALKIEYSLKRTSLSHWTAYSLWNAMLFVEFELNMLCFSCLRDAWMYLSKDCSVWQCFSSHNVTVTEIF